MADSKRQEQLRGWLVYSGRRLAQAGCWWWREIRDLLPRAVTDAFERHEHVLVTSLQGGVARVRLQSVDNVRDVAVLDMRADETNGEAASQALIRGLGESATASIVELDADQFLQRKVVLPTETEERLANVIEFEMDRLTPFHQDQVYFDFRILGRNNVSNTLELELTVAPRETVDDILGRLSGYGINPSMVCVADPRSPASNGTASDKTVNLLPRSQRSRVESRTWLVPWVLAVCCAILTVIAIYVPFHHRQGLVAELEVALEAARDDALSTATVRDEIDQEIERGSFLFTKRGASPTVLRILDELTRVFPDDTWVSRLEISGSRLRIQGESENASSLIGLLEGTAIFRDVSFSSPVTASPRSNLDRFAIESRLNGSSEPTAGER